MHRMLMYRLPSLSAVKAILNHRTLLLRWGGRRVLTDQMMTEGSRDNASVYRPW